jgi:hypothetical protein
VRKIGTLNHKDSWAMLNTGKCQQAQIIPKIIVPLISPKGRSLGSK